MQDVDVIEDATDTPHDGPEPGASPTGTPQFIVTDTSGGERPDFDLESGIRGPSGRLVGAGSARDAAQLDASDLPFTFDPELRALTEANEFLLENVRQLRQENAALRARLQDPTLQGPATPDSN